MPTLIMFHEKINEWAERRHLEELERIAGVNDPEMTLDELIAQAQRKEDSLEDNLNDYE